MRRRFRRPLRRSLVISCLLFIGVLSVLVGIKSYNRLRHAVIERHTAYITDLLRFTAANIDVDDLENCLETGTESEKFRQLQLLLNRIKDTHGIDFIYVIIPLHSGAHDNVMNVIAGLSSVQASLLYQCAEQSLDKMCQKRPSSQGAAASGRRQTHKRRRPVSDHGHD